MLNLEYFYFKNKFKNISLSNSDSLNLYQKNTIL